MSVGVGVRATRRGRGGALVAAQDLAASEVGARPHRLSRTSSPGARGGALTGPTSTVPSTSRPWAPRVSSSFRTPPLTFLCPWGPRPHRHPSSSPTPSRRLHNPGRPSAPSTSSRPSLELVSTAAEERRRRRGGASSCTAGPTRGFRLRAQPQPTRTRPSGSTLALPSTSLLTPWRPAGPRVCWWPRRPGSRRSGPPAGTRPERRGGRSRGTGRGRRSDG